MRSLTDKMEKGLIKKVSGFVLGKCKYADDCAFYDKKSVTCNKTRGEYYNPSDLLTPSRYPGCYREKEEITREIKKST